jgi:iron complex outermembrane receptor protein
MNSGLRVCPVAVRNASRPRSHAVVTAVSAAVVAALYGSSAVASDDVLGEIVVTATRHQVSAQDVPASITAVSGDSLDAGGILDIAGLAHSVAGVNYVDKGPYGGTTGSTLIIRGLNSENTSALAFPSQLVSPVALYVDETPLFANIRLLDLDHVEILRGPQGTLYGSGSLGGTIRFVQNDPDPKAFDAKFEGGLSDTQHTHATNQDVRGMLNVPLADTLAIRLNAGLTNQAGFVNQPALYARDSGGVPLAANPGDLFSPPTTYGDNGTNSYGYRNVRVSALWRPNSDFRAQLSYYYQLSTGNGYPYAAPIYGVDSLTSPDHIRETTRDRVDVVPMTLAYDVGFATLTSATAWTHHTNHTLDDGTSPYQDLPGYTAYYGGNPRDVFPRYAEYDDKRVTQELRLVSKTGGRFEWVIGAFFNSQTTDVQDHDYYPGYNDFYNACAPVYGANSAQCGAGEYGPLNQVSSVDGIALQVDQAYVGDFQSRFRDLAGFAEVTWNLTSAWSVTGGLRVFKQTLTHAQQVGLLFDGPDYVANNSVSDEWRRALWKLNVSYRINADNLVYATRSEGFRPGTANALPAAEPFANYVTPIALTKVSPDTADNYELGIKGTFNRRLRYSAAVYDIQWKNIQQTASLTPLELGGAVNVGDGYSRGVESELTAEITDHLVAQFGYTYDATRLTSLSELAATSLTTPPAVGTQLPGTPKNTVSVNLQYGHIVIGDGELGFAIDAHYQSSIVPAISASVPRVPGYTMLGARTTFTAAEWMYTLYVDNLTNQLGINSYTDPAEYAERYSAIVSRPRTFGFTVGYWLKGRAR